MKPETIFRKKVMERLKRLPDSWWESVQQRTITGSPDVVGCIRGRMIAVELKSEEGKATKLQLHKLKKIREAGGLSYVVRPSTFEGVFSSLLDLYN